MLNNICMDVLKHQISRKKGGMHGGIGKQQSREVPMHFCCLVYFSGTGMLLTKERGSYGAQGQFHVPVLFLYSTSRGAVPDAKAVWIVFKTLNKIKKEHSSENCCKTGLALLRHINRLQYR